MSEVSRDVIKSRQQSIIGQPRVIEGPDPALLEGVGDAVVRAMREPVVASTDPSPPHYNRRHFEAAAVAKAAPRRGAGRPTNAELELRRHVAGTNGDGTAFKIETDVPLPVGVTKQSPYLMSVRGLTRKGMFFFVPERDAVRSRSVAGTIRSIGYRLKVDLTVRCDFTHPKTKEVGVGVWRVK